MNNQYTPPPFTSDGFFPKDIEDVHGHVRGAGFLCSKCNCVLPVSFDGSGHVFCAPKDLDEHEAECGGALNAFGL